MKEFNFSPYFYKKFLKLIADAMGIYYPPSALFLIGIIFLVILLIQFSVIISSISEINKKLAQKIALFEHELNELKEKV